MTELYDFWPYPSRQAERHVRVDGRTARSQGGGLNLTRRQLLVAAAIVPGALAAARVGASLAPALAAAVRPLADGSSAARCAACGAADHSMLDPRCPSAPRVLG